MIFYAAIYEQNRMAIVCKYKNKIISFSWIASLLLSGCMVGPGFHTPATPKVKSYTGGSFPTQTISAAKQAQSFDYAKDVPADWWTLYHSPELDRLVKLGVSHSPTLDSAIASLRQSEEVLISQIGTNFYPSVGLQLSAQRARSGFVVR